MPVAFCLLINDTAIHYKANQKSYMPKPQRTTELLAFRFDSPNCVKCTGSSDKHDSMLVRIRKDEIANIESKATFGSSQVYVRVPATKALSVDVGSFIKITTKRCELCFKVSSIHVLTSITSRTRFHRTAVLSGRFTEELAEVSFLRQTVLE